MNPQELITTLKAQHRTLQTDLSLEGEIKAESILVNLNKFRQDLLDHMKLENETFYTDYLNKKIKNGEDVTDTKEFIKKMDEITVAVIAFLDKYSTSEKISASLTVFRKELHAIISTLSLRIETEEEGVFEFYLLM